MAVERCPPEEEHAPAWRLEKIMGCLPAWQLEVLLPTECPVQNELHVNFNDVELQLETCSGKGSRWRLPVPGYAWPVHEAKCTLSRRRRKLLVQWPRQVTDEENKALADGKALQAHAITGAMHKMSSEAPELETHWPVQREPACQDESLHHAEPIDSKESIPPASTVQVNIEASADNLAPQPHDSSAEANEASTDGVESESQDFGPGAARCYFCGKVATQCCTSCRLVWYCSRQCQRTHWTSDHKTRCKFISKIVCAEKQRHRGDAELALLTLQESMSTINSALKAEADKELTHDSGVVNALLRTFAAAAVVMGAAVAEEYVPDAKLCQAVFYAASTLMDMAANLSEKPDKPRRRPPELQFHVDNIIAALEGKLAEEADPVLSAWSFYNQFSVGLSESLSKYWKKLPKLKVGAIIAFRDVLAASHDLLEASGGDADLRAAARADRLLDLERLKVSATQLKHLRPYLPRGQSNDVVSSWASSDEGSEAGEET